MVARSTRSRGCSKSTSRPRSWSPRMAAAAAALVASPRPRACEVARARRQRGRPRPTRRPLARAAAAWTSLSLSGRAAATEAAVSTRRLETSSIASGNKQRTCPSKAKPSPHSYHNRHRHQVSQAARPRDKPCASSQTHHRRGRMPAWSKCPLLAATYTATLHSGQRPVRWLRATLWS